MKKKLVNFLGDSLSRIREFPVAACKEAGTELRRVQFGFDPTDWKPMPDIGVGVREIRIADASGIFRVMYVTNIGDAVYVLHAFQKKTQETPKRDIDLAKARLKELR
jgi:phage-related protein